MSCCFSDKSNNFQLTNKIAAFQGNRKRKKSFYIELKTKKYDKHKQNLTIVSTNSVSQVIISKTAEKTFQTLHYSTSCLSLTLFFPELIMQTCNMVFPIICGQILGKFIQIKPIQGIKFVIHCLPSAIIIMSVGSH